MKIQLNGQITDVPNGINVRQLLEQKGINPNVVACELNLKILKRANLQDAALNEGDVLEVIQMIGGG